MGKVIGFCSAREAYSSRKKFGLPQCLRPSETAGNMQDKRKRPSDPPDEVLASNHSWPIVQFTCGDEVVCVPVLFEGISASGKLEATRRQVSDLHWEILRSFLT